MLTKTTGIVIKTIKYGDSSAITKILTEEYGLLSYHVPGLYKNKGRIKPSHLQVLNGIEFSFNYSTTKNLQTIKDLSCRFHFSSAQFVRQAYYNVIAELIVQSVRENEQNHSLFNYLFQQLVPSLNEQAGFWQLPTDMLHILYHCGCAPNTEAYKEGSLLDLQDGIFTGDLRHLNYSASDEVSTIIFNLLVHGPENLKQDTVLRNQTIEALILYYKLHINEHFDLKSREVLWQVMKG